DRHEENSIRPAHRGNSALPNPRPHSRRAPSESLGALMGYQLLGLSTDRAVPTGRVRLETPRFYLNIAVYMAALVIIGFWPSYFAPLLHGNAARPWVIHFHSIVFVGWMALLLVQILLVYRGRIQLHRTLGNIGIAYGALVFILGVVVAFAAPILHLKNGEWQME